MIILATGLAVAALAHAQAAIAEAIDDENDAVIEATIRKDIDGYMASVPVDYRIVEDDGSITDRASLREKQLEAWSLITRTNSLEVTVDRVEVGCDEQCATVWTSQRWDRQMLGRDGATEFNVVTTQAHREQWQVRDGRWWQLSIEELGGTIRVDGKPY